MRRPEAAARGRGHVDSDRRPARRFSRRGGDVLGACGVIRVTLLGTRGSMPAPGQSTARYGGNTPCVEVRASDGTLLVLDAGTGIRRLSADPGGHRADRHPADPPAHGPHPGARLLRPALSPRHRGPHLGPGEQHAAAGFAPGALSFAAAVPGPPARSAGHHLPRRAVPRFRDRTVPHPHLAGLPPEPDGRLPDRGGRRGARLSARSRAGARPAQRRLAGAGVDVGVRAGGRRRPSDPRRPVHRRASMPAGSAGATAAIATRSSSPRGSAPSRSCCSITTPRTTTRPWSGCSRRRSSAFTRPARCCAAPRARCSNWARSGARRRPCDRRPRASRESRRPPCRPISRSRP